jgi:sulfite exporter TauE/SafE
MRIKIRKQTLLIGALLTSVALIVYLLFKINSLDNPSGTIVIQQVPQSINLWAIFLTGLLTGGLTCLAVQGGLLAATIAQREEEKLKEKTKQSGNAVPILAFLVAKLTAYTALGFLLGWFGSLFQLSLTTQIIMQLAVAVFMIGTALNILNVHPIFRYFVIQPPKSLTRLVRNQSKSKGLFAPVLLGAFTVFIPCGTTQAMMALAIGSANPFLGAAVLFAFVLGTSPLFFAVGYFATKLGESLHQKFMKIAATALIILAIFNLNNVLALTGSSWTLENIFKQSSNVENNVTNVIPQQSVVIDIKDAGYNPNVVTVKAGTDVSFRIKNDGVYSCASAFTIPAFNYQKVIQAGETETIALKMPDQPTQIPFMCSMGMYRGVINVI